MGRGLLIFGVVFTFRSAFSQNLVSNPSFENIKDPFIRCTWSHSSENINEQLTTWSSPSTGTPDVFSLLVEDSCWSYAFPNVYPEIREPFRECSVGEQLPRTGNVMAGFFAKMEETWMGSEYREYLQGKLLTPMEQGRNYKVIFYLSLGDHSPIATNRFGIHFSDTSVFKWDNHNIGFTPQLEKSQLLTDDTSWTKIEGIVAASSSWQYFIIGNFAGDFYTDDVGTTGQCRGGAYYFIDDVSVELIPMEIIGDSAICDGESVALIARYTSSYKWAEQSDPQTIISTDSILVVSPPIGGTTYLLCGLFDTAYFHVTVHPNPLLFSFDTCEMNWGKIELDAQGGALPYTFQWNDGSAGSSHTLVNDGVHKITVSDKNHCKDTVAVITSCVQQGANIYVAQAFTPNNDGINDYFPVFADPGIISKFEYSIFNRWGNLIFYTDDLDMISTGELNKGWDGTYRGKDQEIGVYLYSIAVEFVNGKTSIKQGNITLIR